MLFLFIAAPLESVMLSHNNRKETYTVKGFMEDASTVCYVAFSEGAHINSRVTRACFDETWMRMPDNGVYQGAYYHSIKTSLVMQ